MKAPLATTTPRWSPIAVGLMLAGCGASPSVNVLGSFFPAWLISIVAGLILSLIAHRILVAVRIAPHLRPAPLVYPCLALLMTFASWLVIFGS